MSEWREVPLEQVAKLAWGDTSTTKASYRPSGWPAYSASGQDGFLPYFDHEEDAVVISAIGALCGKTWLARGRWSCIKNTMWMRALADEAETGFLYHATSRSDFWPRRGAAQPFISLGDAKATLVDLPPVDVQRRIAGFLSAFDEFIEVNERRIELLEDVARSMYREWFVRFRFPGHEATGFVDSEVGSIPEGWDVCRLAEVCQFVRSGGTPRRSDPTNWEGGSIPWFKTGELQDGPLHDSVEHVALGSGARLFDPPAILMAIYGSPTVGRLGWLTRTSSCNQAALALRTRNPEREQEWLWYQLRALRQSFNTMAQGAAQQNISKEKVVATPVCVPPPQVLDAFSSAVGPTRRVWHALAAANETLAATRDLLLPRLVTGRLEVSDINLGELLPAQAV